MRPTLLDIARRSDTKVLYGPRGDVVVEIKKPSPLLPIVEALSVRNRFLQDVPWRARITGLVDGRGNQIYVEEK